MKIRRYDQVVVTSGEDKGKKGKVLKVFPKSRRAIVEGVNFIKRHTRAAPGRQAGIIEREAPIALSKLKIVDPATGQPSRVGYHLLKDGKSQRVAKKSGEALPENEG